MRLSFVFVTGIVAALLVPLYTKNAAPIEDVLRAKRFELIDDNGQVRIEMHMKDNKPFIALKDSDGKTRLKLFHSDEATGVYIDDADGHTRVGLAQFPHGGGLAMHGANGQSSAVYVLLNEKPRLAIYDNTGSLVDRWPQNEEK